MVPPSATKMSFIQVGDLLVLVPVCWFCKKGVLTKTPLPTIAVAHLSRAKTPYKALCRIHCECLNYLRNDPRCEILSLEDGVKAWYEHKLTKKTNDNSTEFRSV